MEIDMAVQMVKQINQSDVCKVVRMAADVDSCSIAKVRGEVDESIWKKMRKQYLKKSVRNALFKLQKTHKPATPTVKYLTSNSSAMLAENANNPAGVKKGYNSTPSSQSTWPLQQTHTRRAHAHAYTEDHTFDPDPVSHKHIHE
jgi:hypothetical protein